MANEPANKGFEQTNGALSEMMTPFAPQPRRSADGGGDLRTPKRGSIVLKRAPFCLRIICLLLGGPATACFPWEPGYKAELRALEAELVAHRTVPRVQEWLARSTKPPALERDKRPSVMAELEPEDVSLEPSCGGVTLMVRRGDIFTVTICPPGSRPPVAAHEPSMEKPGYVGEFGSDAYITMTER